MTPLTKGATIGIIGGGQLGMMLVDAAHGLGFYTHIFSPIKKCPANRNTDHITVAEYDDEAALSRFAEAVDVVTFEFENIPPSSLRFLQTRVGVFPKPDMLDICRNRNVEKQTLNQIGLRTAPFLPVHSADDLGVAVKQIGTPSVLKTSEMGYDGKGQVKLESPEGLEGVWHDMGTQEATLEGWIPFERELSVIVARDMAGTIVCYDPVHNIHRDHILHKTIAPAPNNDDVNQRAIEVARTIAESLKLVGVLAVELFVTKQGEVLVNEMAPRPHNSGHWTIEGAKTSQFTQLIRIVVGLGVGSAETSHACEMVNLIGDEVNDISAYGKDPKAHIHLYGKEQVRAGRKMGHVTIVKD